MVYMELRVDLQTHTHKFSDALQPMRKKFKKILTYLCCTKYNENNVCHLDTQKHAFCEKWLIQYKPGSKNCAARQ